MNYLYDKKKKIRRKWYLIGIIFLMVLVFTPIFQRIFNLIEKPLAQGWEKGNQTIDSGLNFFQSWYGHKEIARENKELKEKIAELEINALHTHYLEQEIEKFRTIETENDNTVPAHITKYLSGNELIIDQGLYTNINIGDIVIAHNRVLVGVVNEVFNTVSRVEMFSKPSKNLVGVLNEQNLKVRGHGTSTYVIEAPREVEAETGDLVYSQEYPGYIIGVVSAINFDPRDPFKTIYLSLPVNIQNLQLVGVVK